MTPREVLVAARELVSVPERWTRGAFARDENGDRCSTVSGVRFCVHGAIKHFAQSVFVSDQVASVFAIANGVANDRISDFNDDPETTHPDIVAVFDRAIAAAGEA